MTGFARLYNDWRVIWSLIKPRSHQSSHSNSLENFYRDQSELYDDFRERLLPGRKELIEAVIPEGFSGVWIDVGGGTGRTVEYVAHRLAPSSQVIILDLCQALLKCADERIARHGWSNVHTRSGDVNQCHDFNGAADVVSFSFSLSMIPDWVTALDSAHRMLRHGGRIALVDFTCGHESNSLSTTLRDTFWRYWFSYDGVELSALHRLEAQNRFTTESLTVLKAKVPYMLGMRVPYYRFVGIK
jgi:S-adenosylmethionine-diacylgycerolhomoserine-N-methlytransferase